MRRLDVVAGILRDGTGRVLITERLGDGPFQGLWEFPGGKIAADESPLAALARELDEEIGIEAVESAHFMSLTHDYPDRHVAIAFYLVTAWRRDPTGREGQRLRWVETEQLHSEPLLPADQPVVEALQSLSSVAGVQQTLS